MKDFQSMSEAFRASLEASPDGFILFRPEFNAEGELKDFIFIFMNEAAGKLSGTKPREVIGRRMLEIFPGQKNTRFFCTYREVAQTGEARAFEDRYKGETITEENGSEQQLRLLKNL